MKRFSFLKVIISAFIGFFIAAAMTLAGFLLVHHRIMLGPPDTDEVQAWTWFAATMTSVDGPGRPGWSPTQAPHRSRRAR